MDIEARSRHAEKRSILLYHKKSLCLNYFVIMYEHIAYGETFESYKQQNSNYIYWYTVSNVLFASCFRGW